MGIAHQARAIIVAASSLGLCMMICSPSTGAMAQTPAAPQPAASKPHLTAQEFSAQARRILRRSPRRVRIYRSANEPGPNSVRICNARYEQEFRPSGTVIVPRVSCRWSG